MGITSCASSLFVSCSTERSKRGECYINRSQLSYGLTGSDTG